MMTPAGKGGIYETSHPSIKTLNSNINENSIGSLKENYIINASLLWKSYGIGDISDLTLLKALRETAILKEVNIDANNRCNLSCRQCIFAFKDLRDSELTCGEWEAVLDECIRLGAQFFAVSGKEPFSSDKAIRILDYLKMKKDREKVELSTGIVTNGTLIGPYLNELPKLELDFLVFSVDGLKKEHDAFRGTGVFDRVTVLIKQTVALRPADRVLIASIYHRENVGTVDQMFSHFYNFGIRHFTFQPLLITSGVPMGLAVDARTFKILLKKLQSLKIQSNDDPSCEIIIDLEPQFMPDFYEFCSEGLVEPENLKSDVIGTIFQKIETNNGINLYLRYLSNSCKIGNLCRITADGHYLMDFQPLTKAEYWKEAIGNVKNEGMEQTFKRVFEKQGPISKTIRKASTSVCRAMPCFTFCLGGNALCRYSNIYRFKRRKHPKDKNFSLERVGLGGHSGRDMNFLGRL